ncbi:hypothetical protein Lesp02_03620 [Lentzea sp. NBRC 105346]|uniref:hypothetical protein n=1 Tax=Lentzea sp. NBRC 105346 TaxID=3032205 RepID=UPI0024A5C90D|nr:hypothetical protein [Lentzea sp. NBRC 105346]GLZ28172.1 hypothetical protein Lesp02_03620 [Lentzea sp. NBRC 105346]
MFEGLRVNRELGEVREKGIEVVVDRNAVFPDWFTRTVRAPTFLMQEQGLFLPPEIPASLYAWLNTKTGRRLGYVVYERPTALGPLPMAHLVPQAMMRRSYPDGEEPY